MNRLGIILAGGQSQRMGQNKALLQIGGRTVIGTIIEAMSPVCGQMVVSSMHPELYEFTGLPVIPDRYEGAGPLAGIHAALNYSGQEWNLVCSCDHPFASRTLFEGLIDLAEQADESVEAVIPVYEGRIQPLVAVYRRRSYAQLDYGLEQGERRVLDWINRLNVKQIEIGDWPDSEGREAGLALFNMNRPEDYTEALRLASKLEHKARPQ
ncbi:molybdenum cofactor guanylyltransferase [Paenibacillus physcomitrellae]|uniref:Probable molybdenum cofactor guanylyltransferase n=1 Tax=Paenibacillus physcomitrellae TaxID=1619311 RepID=A0ABQ1GFM6_9BACL|nr:molybdenum cofactor guanylyltransferase [Paenibacillus physcomitrellae]GGA42725.1 hypothetical protein GCM10010917_30070 [Paenibacillus physcomitrellae]